MTDHDHDQPWTTYRIGGSTFQVGYGDLTTSSAEVLVSSDDNHLSMGGGVSWALADSGGAAVRDHGRKLQPAAQSDVVVTTAGNLTAKYIFHAITVDLSQFALADDNVVCKATRRVLELADVLRIRSLGFPALGTGVGGLPFSHNANVMVQTIADHLAGDTCVEEVSLYLRRSGSLRGQDGGPAVFYQRAAALAASAGQTRTLYRAVLALDGALAAANRPDVSAALQQLLVSLDVTRTVLAQQPASIGDVDRIEEDSHVLDTGRTAVALTEQNAWDDRQIELRALRTRLGGLNTQLNVHYGSLNKLEIDRAHYGGVGVPLILENQIALIKNEISQVEEQARDTRAKLASFGNLS